MLIRVADLESGALYEEIVVNLCSIMDHDDAQRTARMLLNKLKKRGGAKSPDDSHPEGEIVLGIEIDEFFLDLSEGMISLGLSFSLQVESMGSTIPFKPQK